MSRNLCRVYRAEQTVFFNGLELRVVCHCWDTEAASYDFQLHDFDHFCSKSSSFKVLRCPSVGGSHSVCSGTCVLSYPPKHKRERVERRNGHNECGVLHICSSFFSSSLPVLNPTCFSIDAAMQSRKGSAFLNVSAPSLGLCCVQRAGGLWRVIASRCPCTFSAVWTPGL